MSDEADRLARQLATLDADALRRLEAVLSTTPCADERVAPRPSPQDPVLVRLREGRGPDCILAAPSVGDLRKLKAMAGAMSPRSILGLLPAEASPAATAAALRQQLADRAAAAVLGAGIAGPVVFGGFCLAGLLALDAAEAIRAAGGRVSGVVLIDTFFAPSPFRRRLARLRELAHHHLLGLRASGSGGRLPYLAARLAALPAYLRRRRGQRKWLGEAMATDGVLATTLAAFRFARPRPTTLPVLYIFSRDGKVRGAETATRRVWAGVAVSRLEWVSLPASHETLFDEPHLRELAGEIERFLAALPSD